MDIVDPFAMRHIVQETAQVMEYVLELTFVTATLDSEEASVKKNIAKEIVQAMDNVLDQTLASVMTISKDPNVTKHTVLEPQFALAMALA